MKIFLFGNDGSATHILYQLLASKHDVVGICGRRLPWYAGPRQQLSRLLERTGLRISGDFFYRDVFDGTPSVRLVARKRRIRWFGSAGLRTLSFERALRSLSPDVCLVASFHRLIPTNILAVAKLATINFHPSLLPRHRGGTPNRWVVRWGETTTGVTAHFVAPTFDTGEIIAQEVLSIVDGETWGEIERRLAKVAAALAMRVVDNIEEGQLTGQPQNESDATFERSFKRENQFINWRGSALDVMRTCNAMRPKSGGLTIYNGKIFCLWETAVIEGNAGDGEVGEVIAVDSNGSLIVRCGNGRTRIRSFLHRGKLISGAEAARRCGFVAGAKFMSVDN